MRRSAAAFAAGALLACAFEPLGWWPLAILCPAVLMFLWEGATPRRAAWHGFWFNAGTFSVGTYWLYISIHLNGGAPVWIAFMLMAALVAIMAAYHALLGYCAARWLPSGGATRWLVALPSAWLLIEWWRGWFLSGFSWLSLGYSQTDTWLANLAPVGGIYLLSAVLLFGAGALVALVRGARRIRLVAAAVLIVPWALAAALQPIRWTHPSGPPVRVAVVQGAIPQDQKWLEANRDATLRLYRSLTRTVLGTPLIVWPESAPPDLANRLTDYLGAVYAEASASGSSVVMGITRASDDLSAFYNSILSLGRTVAFYDKRNLVPFGEFFPVPDFIRSWLRLISLPDGDFTRGLADQPPLDAAGLRIAPTICYEDAYGSSQLRVLREADVLVNVTNDAWFGHSSARYQHFQIARMRAMEAGRYMVRAANDGVSAVIDPFGRVVSRAPEFQPFVLKSQVVPYRGLPPYARVGNWPIIGAAAFLLLAMSVWNLYPRSRSIAKGAGSPLSWS